MDVYEVPSRRGCNQYMGRSTVKQTILLSEQAAPFEKKWRLSREQRPPQYQKLGDAAIGEFFCRELFAVWKIHQNLRAITSIMIHKVWSHVARKNTVEKGSPASAHMAPGQVTEPVY